MSQVSKWTRVRAAAAAALVAAVTGTGLLALSVGDVDPTFGAGGVTTFAYGQNGTRIAATLQMPDQSQVVAGTVITGTSTVNNVTSFTYDAVVMRFTKEGALDTSFNATGATPGVLQFDLGTDELITAASLDLSVPGHPRVVLAGMARRGYFGKNSMAVARVDDTGQLDSTFGTGGLAFLPFVDDPLDDAQQSSADAQAWTVAVQADGKVVVGGQAKNSTVYGSGYAYVVTRLDATGVPDASFTTVRAFFGSGDQGDFGYTSALDIDSDGSVVAALVNSPGIAAQLYLLRIPASGGSTNPPVRIYQDDATSVRILPASAGAATGKILVGGTDLVTIFPTLKYDWSLARYNPDLTPDSTFGTGGVVSFDSGGTQDRLHSLVVLADGRLLLAGTVGAFGPEDVGVVRLLADGQRDTSFGPAGLQRVNLVQNDLWGAAVAQGERIVVVDNIDDLTQFGGIGLTRILGAVPTVTMENGVQITEGNAGTTTGSITVSLSQAFQETVTVDYETWMDPFIVANYPAATAGVDYVATSGTVTFLPGETSKTFDVTVNGDSLYEGLELISVRLLNPSANANMPANTSSGTAGIAEDDPTPLVSVASASVTEGNSGTKDALVTLTQSAPCALPSMTTFMSLASTGGAIRRPPAWTSRACTTTPSFQPGRRRSR